MPVSEKVIPDDPRVYTKLRGKPYGQDLVAFAIVYDDLDIRDVKCISDACFAEIMKEEAPQYLRLDEAKYIISRSLVGVRCYRDLTFKECTSYLSWLLNDSPCADAFITKCPLHAYRRGVTVSAEASAPAVGFALLMHRALWEYPGHVRTFEVLFNSHINTGLCLALMSDVITNKSLNMYVSGYGMSHGPLPSVFNPEIVKDVRSLRFDGEDSFRSEGGYTRSKPFISRGSRHWNRVLKVVCTILNKSTSDHLHMRRGYQGSPEHFRMPVLLSILPEVYRELTAE